MLKTQRITLSTYGENVLKYSMDNIAYSPLVGYWKDGQRKIVRKLRQDHESAL